MNLLSENIPICFANDPQYIVKLIGKIIAFIVERFGEGWDCGEFARAY